MVRFPFDFADCRGASDAIAAIERATIAHLRAVTAGEPSPGLIFVGPPGMGKTMLARRIPTILPALGEHASTWLTAEYQGLGLHEWCQKPITERPFRAPHYTISTAALVGAPGRRSLPCPMCTNAAERGQPLDPFHRFHQLPGLPREIGRPGELQLARFGVLFLDEMIEFSLAALGELRDGLRAMAPRTRPMIVAASSLCPCGWTGYPARQWCTCTPEARDRYAKRLGQAITALDLRERAEVAGTSLVNLPNSEPGPSSAAIRERVCAAIGVAS